MTTKIAYSASNIVSTYLDSSNGSILITKLLNFYKESADYKERVSDFPESIPAFQALERLVSDLQQLREECSEESEEDVLQRFAKATDNNTVGWALHMLSSYVGSDQICKDGQFYRQALMRELVPFLLLITDACTFKK